MRALLRALTDHAARRPQQVALRGVDREWRFAELHAAMVELAEWLIERLGDDGEPIAVGLYGENSPAWVIADLALGSAAALRAGGLATVPLPGFFSEGQLAHIQQSTNLRWMLLGDTERCPLPVEASWPAPVAGLRLLRLRPAADCNRPRWGAQVAKITFTSGTSGQPKGVCLPAPMLDAVVAALAERIHSGLAVETLAPHINLMPLSTLLENLAGVYLPLHLGRSVIAIPGSALGLSGSSGLQAPQLLGALNEHRPGSLILLPQLLYALVQMVEAGATLPDTLRFVAVGGGVCSPTLLARAEALGIDVFQGYGLSEAASVVSLNAPGANKPGSAGRPLSHLQLRVRDRHIEIRGEHRSHYLGEPPTPATAWLDSGDLGRIDEDGYLYIDGRHKHLLISSYGRNIAPEWLEGELALCPAVAQAVVLGDGQPYCAALIVPRPGLQTQLAAQIESLNRRLPDYARIQGHQIVPPFTACDGTLTDNGRLRRERIAVREAAAIAALFTPDPAEMELQMPFFDRLQAQTSAEREYLLSSPVIRRCFDGGGFTLAEYVAFLTEAYHHVRHTVPLMMAAGSRLPRDKEQFREAVAEYIEEEIGHQEWILNDIAACGADPEQVRHGQPGMATEMMVAYAYDGISRTNPLSLFGMVLVLEGTSTQLATAAAQIIQQRLQLPDRAFSYLRSHGSLDIKHMQFFEGLMNKVDSVQDQAAIIHAAKRFYVLYGNVFRSIEGAQALPEAA